MFLVFSVTWWRCLSVWILSFCCLNWIIMVHREIMERFKSYLYNRKWRVELKSLKTQNFCFVWEIVKHGVCQDLVLGPFLFNVSINDFPLQINWLAEVIMFANNTSILVSATYDDFMIVFNLVLLHISKRFQANPLILHVEKTSTVHSY